MDKKKTRRDYGADHALESVVSYCEATGLTPAPPLTEAQAEAYASLYAVPQRPFDPERDTRH